MFAKKELTDADIEQIKLNLQSSMRQAEESRSRFIAERVKKLNAHSRKIESIKNNRALTTSNVIEQKNFPAECEEFVKEIQEIKSAEGFQSYMQRQENIQRAEKLVNFIESSHNQLVCDEIRNRPKIFMSMMLLARFGSEVMPSPSVEEQRLVQRSIEFLDLLLTSNEAKDIKSMAWKWSKAIILFTQWSSKDRFTLRTKMRQDFLRWQKKIGNLQQDSSSHAEWEPHVLEYQIQVINKIYQVFGHGEVDSLKTDITELNKTFANADLVVDFDKESGQYKCFWKEKSKSTDINNKENMELLKETRKKIQNIQILHELMLKEDSVNFEKVLNMAGSSTLDEITKKNIETITKLTLMLKDVQESDRIVRVLVDIFEYMRSSLIELAGDNPDYRKEIENIDCSISSCDWVKESASFLHSILLYCQKCCAPVRDSQCLRIEASLEKLIVEETTDGIAMTMMQTVSDLLELLNNMRSDFSNFRLKMLAIHLEGKGVAERYELDHLLEQTGNKLTKTEKWLLSYSLESEKPIDILAKAYLDLFDPQRLPVAQENLPETFSLDVERIERYRTSFHQHLIFDTIALFLKNNLSMDEAQFAPIEEKIKSTRENEQILSIIDPILSNLEQGDVLKGAIRRLLLNPCADKVFMLLKNRSISRIRSKMIFKKDRLVNPIEEKIASLFHYNKACYSEIYDKILKK